MLLYPIIGAGIGGVVIIGGIAFYIYHKLEHTHRKSGNNGNGQNQEESIAEENSLETGEITEDEKSNSDEIEPEIQSKSSITPIEKSSLTEQDRQRLLNAVWYRCENPYCKYTQFLDVRHIIAESENGTNKLNNLIVLCSACHTLADNKEIPVEVMQSWIANTEDRFKHKLEWNY
jgi:5-methylcytosine-specific restriction endonuclease McrA